MSGILYVVATPIGNLGDISARALETLGSVDAVLAEDTRVGKKLLTHFDIDTPIERFDAQVEHDGTSAQIIQRLESGENLALITDAGTPGVSDPGAHLIRMLQEHAVKVVPIPGASALTAALSVSGLAPGPILFLGFPPHKKGRKTFFENLQQSGCPVVMYESVHRFIKTMTALKEYVPHARIGVFRELTKMHEEIVHGTPLEVEQHYQDNPDHIRGEFVIIVEL